MKGEVALGRVVRAHGIRGAVRVLPYDDDSANLPRLRRATLRLRGGSVREAAVVSITKAGKTFLATFEGVEDRDQAEALVGAEIVLDRSEFAPLPEGRHYLVDLIGLTVRTQDGAVLGKLADVMKTGANDVLVVGDDAGREVLLPDLPDVVLAIEPEAGRIVVRVPPGLLDDDG
jgi:16S rRNA processing protein RimM